MPPTSQDLVPTGGAYGARQENVALMRQAGTPLASAPPASTQGPSANQPPGAAPSPRGAEGFNPLSLLAEHTPDEFPFAGQPQPDQTGTEPDSVISALASSAQSTFGLAVLARLQHNRAR